MQHKPRRKSVPSESAIVAKAALRAADRLDVTNKLLAKILAVMFVRLYRSLDAVIGGDDAVAKAWLRNKNSALKEAPIDLVQSVWGLTEVIQYLDARRALA